MRIGETLCENVRDLISSRYIFNNQVIVSHFITHVFGVGVENKTSREISCSNVVTPHRKSNKMVSLVCAVQLTRTVSVNR